MSREELKQLWFSLDYSNVPERKEIIVEMDKYKDRLGQGTIEIISEGPNGYSSFKTHQEYPYTYLANCEEYKTNKYKLIVK